MTEVDEAMEAISDGRRVYAHGATRQGKTYYERGLGDFACLHSPQTSSSVTSLGEQMSVMSGPDRRHTREETRDQLQEWIESEVVTVEIR